MTLKDMEAQVIKNFYSIKLSLTNIEDGTMKLLLKLKNKIKNI
tara:strand:- start:35 stop:163 length:129 start_codon:yes stop_codon:yes gene_type:complete